MLGLGEIATGLNLIEKLWDKFKKLWTWHQARKNPPPESVASRFIRVFESHGVHRNQIPRFFGHGLKLQDLQDEASLLAKLDETALEDLCERFAVRREWLDGAEPQVHPCHNFYKEPRGFLRLVETLKRENLEGQFSGIVLAPIEKDHDAEALLILQESIGFVGEKLIYRYHICNNWTFTYWKARAYLTACIAVAWNHQIYVHGIYTSKKQIAALSEGHTLLGWKGEGVWSFGVKRWDPEDMALRPDAFLNGIDPERNNFGIEAGLKHWLELEHQGFMNTGSGKTVRPLFEHELGKYFK